MFRFESSQFSTLRRFRWHLIRARIWFFKVFGLDLYSFSRPCVLMACSRPFPPSQSLWMAQDFHIFSTRLAAPISAIFALLLHHDTLCLPGYPPLFRSRNSAPRYGSTLSSVAVVACRLATQALHASPLTVAGPRLARLTFELTPSCGFNGRRLYRGQSSVIQRAPAL